ncbi:S-methyl-5'-thioadenosine phosphorylase [Peromyscus californicus insignis]|uniref:S-methyl-5'-thioadenosine phosphorylase n=1 Tax=Peromyscus californicus insignis TaxID=564181 RepID=UPI0022A68F17|nr:S-methyl-5'-thioadenosine phosphorylase [Peromyscus californicus insignis]
MNKPVCISERGGRESQLAPFSLPSPTQKPGWNAAGPDVTAQATEATNSVQSWKYCTTSLSSYERVKRQSAKHVLSGFISTLTMDPPSRGKIREAPRTRKVRKRVGRREPDLRRRVPGEQPIPRSRGGRGGARARGPPTAHSRAAPAPQSPPGAALRLAEDSSGADMASGAACAAVKIGIIGGTGLDDPEILEGRTEKYVDTPFGKPSDALILGKIKNVDCVLLARHGRQHTIMPSKVNYQANIWALKEEGCTHVIVTTACGSLREEIQPGDMVIIDQFIDRTSLRPQTFYDGSHCGARGVCHIPMAEPFCPKTREVLIETAKKLGLRCHSKGTIVTIEGPRFSSRAESFVFRTWGADVINMTTVPEVVLAKEAGICYASIAMATDYDCWKEHEEAVSVDGVLKTMKENANKAKSLLLTTIPQIGSMEWSETLRNLKNMAQSSVLPPRH